jgi:uncharacterized protein YndB with AHSA1/START domain
MSGASRDDPFQPMSILRTIDAPREKIWAALTEAAHLRRWWPPAGSKVLSCSMDLRQGGFFLFGARTQDGAEIWTRHVYNDIWAPSQLVYIDSYSDAGGRAMRRPGWPHWPIEVLTTVSLAKSGGGTKLSIRSLPRNATDMERSAFDRERFTIMDTLGGQCERLTHYVSA